MVGMIEHINGVGLSGMAGKTGKHAKNSLFDKLLAMFERRAQLSGKGQALHSGKGNISGVLSDKSDPLIAAKSKHLLGLARKGIHSIKVIENDKRIPLIAAHVLIDIVSQNKKIQTGKTMIAGEQANLKGEQVNPAVALSIQSVEAGIPLLIGTQAGKAAVQAGKSTKEGQSILFDAKASALETPLAMGSNTAALASTGLASDGIQVPTQSQKITAKVQGSVSETGKKIDISASAQTLTGNEASAIKRQQVTGVFDQPTAPTKFGAESIAKTTDGLQSPVQAKAGLQVNIDSQARAALQTHVESAKALAAAHVQQVKTAQLQQGQNVAASPLATSAAMTVSGISDASLADSGSQSSGKGNQDGRYVSVLSSDAKLSSSTASVHSNFNQYLSGKTAPTMTLFDSMTHIAQSASKGKTRLEIQLEPANLGKIQISLQSDASKQLQVHITVEQQATRQLIDQQLPALKHALMQQGLDLSGFSMGSHGEQAFSGFSNRQTASKSAGSDFKSENAISPPPSNPQSATHHDGRLSIHV